MDSIVFVIPGQLTNLTGGYLYNKHVIEGLRKHGWFVELKTLDESFPFPTTKALKHASGILANIQKDSRVVIDGLALSAMPTIIEREALRLRIIALIHLPLGFDVSLDQKIVSLLRTHEARSLHASRLIIVTGHTTVKMLNNYKIKRDKIVVVEPGTERAPLTRGSKNSTLNLLSVATLNPIKGHEILLKALASIPNRKWKLTCVGSTTRHPDTTNRLRAMVYRLGLENQVLLTGELDAKRLSYCYNSSDLFVLATRQETYGMAVAEALAHGLPVVSTTSGAIPNLVGNHAGILVPPGDTKALSNALERIINNNALRIKLTQGARLVRKQLAGWEQTSKKMSIALRNLSTHE